MPRRSRPKTELVDLLGEQVGKALRTPLAVVFGRVRDQHEESLQVLAEAIESIAPEHWRRNRNLALLAVMGQAAQLLSDKEYPRDKQGQWQSKIHWRDVGTLLCGFGEGIPPRPDGEFHTFSDFRAELVVRSELTRVPRRTFDEHVVYPLRPRLADILLHRQDELRALVAGPLKVGAPAELVEAIVVDQTTTDTIELPQLAPAQRFPRTPYLDYAAQQLALGVLQVLEAEVIELGLNNSMLPLRWVNAFNPSTADHRGSLGCILETYNEVPSGRLVVLGRAGAGKSVFALRLALVLVAAEQPDMRLVPVKLVLSSWNPARSYYEWIAESMLANGLIRRTLGAGGRDLALDLIRCGYILPVLDGLDEMSPKLRAQALKALDVHRLPFVLTSRPNEYLEAARERNQTLEETAHIRLTGMTLNDLRGHLREDGWAPVLSRLAEKPTDPQSKVVLAALSTPLMVSLARTVYSNPKAKPRELLNPKRFLKSDDIVTHLLQAYTPAAFDRIPVDKGGPPAKKWRPEDAERWLRFLALHMWGLQTTRLEWWPLRHAAPRTWLIALVAAVTGGICVAPSAIIGCLLAGFSKRIPEPRRLNIHGIGSRLRSDKQHGLRNLLRGTLCIAGVEGGARLVGRLWHMEDLATASPLLLFALAISILALMKAATRVALTEPLDPRAAVDATASLRADRIATPVVAGTFGITMAVLGTVIWVIAGNPTAIDAAGLFLMIFVVCFQWSFIDSAWGAWLYSRMWLSITGRLPWRLLALLEDANQRGVLRKVNGGYEFRHVLLYEQMIMDALAENPRTGFGRRKRSWALAVRRQQARRLWMLGKVSKASGRMISVIGALGKTVGREHPSTLTAILDHGWMLLQQGWTKEAEEEFTRVLKRSEARSDPRQPDIGLRARHGLAATVAVRGDVANAAMQLEALHEEAHRLHGPRASITKDIGGSLANVRADLAEQAAERSGAEAPGVRS